MRGAIIGYELLEVGSTAQPLQNIPGTATMIRVVMNPQALGGSGDTPTGPVVSMQPFTQTPPSESVGVQFTANGGYFEFIGIEAIRRFKAISLTGDTWLLQVYYCIYPWG